MKKKNIRQCAALLCCIALAMLVSSRYHFRVDLTAEKRYTLSPETRQILRQLNAPLYADIFLDGDIPVQFRKLRNSIREMFDDFRACSGNRIICRFTDPSDAASRQEREARYAGLEEKGIRKITINKTNRDGGKVQYVIFPGAVISYKDRSLAVNLLSDNRMLPYEMALNASLETLEYKLIETVNALCADSVGRVVFITGHGESGRAETYDFASKLADFYEVERKPLNGRLEALDPYRAAIVVKPRQAFDERDKFVIDRYIMRGGKVMWLLDGANVNVDSLSATGTTLALASELNLEDQLFTYGVRVNPVVVQDIAANTIPVVMADGSSQPALAPWLYYPLATPASNHAITRNLSPVWLRYASDIDTVGSNRDIRKTALLQTSELSRTKNLPFMISLNEVERMPDRRQFNKPRRTVAVLLEGCFPSVFRSRNPFPEWREKQIGKSVETRMLVVADGDIACNGARYTPDGAVPAEPLGYDGYTRETFANREFLINALNYLADDAGLMNLRNREFRLRLLNKQKTADELLKWQIVNLALPMLLLAAGGFVFNRRRSLYYGRNNRPKNR